MEHQRRTKDSGYTPVRVLLSQNGDSKKPDTDTESFPDPETEKPTYNRIPSTNGKGRTIGESSTRRSSRVNRGVRYTRYGALVDTTAKRDQRGKSRRHKVFKKSTPTQSPSSRATVVIKHSLFNDGIMFTINDVVSLVGLDGRTYYATVRGFLQDEFGKGFAYIQWMVPTTLSRRGKFDPVTWVPGPEDLAPRSIDSLEFVCHPRPKLVWSQGIS